MNALEIVTKAERALRQIEHELTERAARQGIILTGHQLLMLARMRPDPVPVNMVRDDAYLGSNVSYNIKKLTEAGLIEQSTTPSDGRRKFVKPTKRGTEVADLARAIIDELMPARSAALQAIAA